MRSRLHVLWRLAAFILGVLAAIAVPARSEADNPAKRLLEATVTIEVESAETENKDVAEPAKRVLAVASGTVLSADGLIVAAQVPDKEGADYFVRPHAGKRMPARLVVSDRRNGLRLLQVTDGELTHVEIAEQPAEIGQRILAVVVHQGLPVRYIRRGPHDLASGIIAATARRVEGVPVELLQTDVRSGAGSAGAPIADEQGRLVGILTAVEVSDEENHVSLAVPARYVRELLKIGPSDDTLVIRPAYLGVQLESGEESGGAVIAQVFDDSPAAKAELKPADVILSVNEQEVETAEELTAAIGQQTPGDKVTLRVKRGDEEPKIEVVLAERPEQPGLEVKWAEDFELDFPGEYRVVPLPELGAGQGIDPTTLRTLQTWLQKAQIPHRDPNRADTKLPIAPRSELTPLTVYVQRPEADERLDRLTEEVKSLREEVKKLAEQMQTLSRRLDKPGAPLSREEAIQSLRDEFLKKLDDLVRQQDALKSK